MIKRILFVTLFLLGNSFIYPSEIKKCDLNVLKIDLSKFTGSEGISTVKSLRDNSIVFSLNGKTYYSDFYLWNSQHADDFVFLCREYGGSFNIKDNKILFLDKDGYICSFDPYMQKIESRKKPLKMFLPYEDSNDKRKRKYQFSSSSDNFIVVNRYKKDLSFEYKHIKPKLPYSDYKILSATNGKTENDFYMLLEKSNKLLIVNYDWKRKRVLKEISIALPIGNKHFTISSSPNSCWIMICYKDISDQKFLLYEVDSDIIYQADLALEKYARFQDWDFDSRYMLFSCNDEKVIYKIGLPND